MTRGEHKVKAELKKWLSDARRTVVAGIGNPIQMDDFVGVKIVQDLMGKTCDKILLLECETVPENYLDRIASFDPTHILLIDAAILGLKPGEARLVEPKKLISVPAVSTHMLPLRIFCDYLSTSTKARIALLLIEPEQTEFGEGLTEKVNVAAKRISNVLLEIFSKWD